MPRNFWHCIAGNRIYDIMDQAKNFDVDGLILEFDISDDLPTRGWNWIFEDLALYEDVPGFEKKGDSRDAALRLRANINRMIDEAAARGIDLFIMGPELSYDPKAASKWPELTDPSSDFMYQFAAGRLAEIFDALPILAGVKLYLDEGMLNINDINSSVPLPDRMYRLISGLLDVCRRKNRTLIVTTFTLMPHQMKAITGALKRIPPCEHLIVDNYICPGDWGRIKLFNPSIGDVGGHPEQISFDYCGEVWGQSVIPLCQADFISESLRKIRDKGIEPYSISGYVSWRVGKALGTLNESTIYTAGKIAKGCPDSADELVLEWAKERYGVEAASYIVSALKRTRETVLKSWHDFGFWVQELPKSEPADLSWYNWSLHWESLAIWDQTCRPLESMLFFPTEETVQKVIEEKEEAVRLARESLADIEKAKPFLNAASYEELRRYFNRGLTMCNLFRYYSEAFYRARMFHSGDKSQESLVCAAVAKIREIADEIEKKADDGFWICRPERLRFITSQFADILEGKEWPEVGNYKEFRVEEWNRQLKEWGYPVNDLRVQPDGTC